MTDPVIDLGISLRCIDQGYRRVFVGSRTSSTTIPNPNDWPVQSFAIPQKRTGRDRLPQIVGPIGFAPFQPDGTTTVRVQTSRGKVEEIRLGIVQVNELFAEAIGLTHNWKLKVSTRTLPAGILFPGMLSTTPGFEKDGFKRLDVAKMLIKAERIDEAAAVLSSIQEDFPDIADQIPQLRTELLTARGRQLLSVLDHRFQGGQYRLAQNAGRLFPTEDLAPEVLLQARQLATTVDQIDARCNAVRLKLNSLVARISDESLQQRTSLVIPEIIAGIHPDTIDRFAAFELLSAADDLPAEASLALAISGWIIGTENALQNLEESLGLFEARQLVIDYLLSTPSESAYRAELQQRIGDLEGVSAERLGSLILQLPAIDPPRLSMDMNPASRRYRTEAMEGLPAMAIQLPPEFNPHRLYPVVLAFAREGISIDDTVSFWGPHADNYGSIVASIELFETNAADYDASAVQHALFLNALRHLKHTLPVDDDRIFAVGHGMGSEAAIDMATSHSDSIAGVVSISGMGRRHFQWTAMNNPDLPWYIVIGEGQGNWFERMRYLLTQLFKRDTRSKQLADVLLAIYPDRGFESYQEELPEVFEWMQFQKRNMQPELINAQLLRSTDRRWAWIEAGSLPAQFAQLDQPTVWSDSSFRAGELTARLTAGNGILISQCPGSSVTVRLGPDMPLLDFQKPITIQFGRLRRSIDYSPSMSDMLEDLYETGERKRLCLMKVQLGTAP
ncbi:MAG: hypothetical protein R3C20_19275 [Planctomycetaceae bacterium]